MKRKGILGTICSITGVILIAKLLGFIKQMVVASSFGTTIETDLINLSQSFIGNIQYVIVQVLVTAFISVYIHIGETSSEEAKSFSSDTIKAFTIIAGASTALVLIAAPGITKIIAPTYSSEQSQILSSYLRIYSPVLIPFTWTAIFQALLNANKRFIPGEIINLNQSILLIFVVLTFRSKLGVDTLVWGFFAYAIWNTCYLGFLVRKYWRYYPGNPFANPSVRHLMKMCAPLLVGYSMVYINQMVDKILVSGLEAGAVTALNYGAVLSNLVTTFIISFGSILFSYVTSQIAKGEHRAAAEQVNWSAELLILVFLPISILTIICAQDVVTIAFKRGAFDADSVRIAADALAGYGFSFVPIVLREVYSRVHYGYQNSRQPMINSTIGVVANIILSIALYSKYGVLGIAFASSVSVCISGFLNAITARKHNPYLSYKRILRHIPLMCVAGILCVVIANFGNQVWAGYSPMLRFILVTVCAGGVYFLTVSPLIYRLIRKKGKNVLS